MLGALAEMGIPENDARAWEEGLRSGGTLVTVRTSEEHADRAQRILDQHGAIGIGNDSEVTDQGWEADNPHREAPNFGDEGGSSQWGRTMLDSQGSRLRSRMYKRTHPDNRTI
jgi:hypothetical protein